MNAIMGNLGNAISPSLTLSAGAAKAGAAKTGGTALPFAAILSDLGAPAAKGQPASPTPAVAEPTEGLSLGDLLMIAEGHATKSQFEGASPSLKVASPAAKADPELEPLIAVSGPKISADEAEAVPEKPILKLRPEKAAVPRNVTLPAANADAEIDPNVDASPVEPDVSARQALPATPSGDAAMAVAMQAALLSPPSLEAKPVNPVLATVTAAPKAVGAASAEPAAIPAKQSVPTPEVPQDIVKLTDSLSIRDQGRPARKALPNALGARLITEGGGQSTPVARQQNATAALLAGLARQKDLPPDIAARLVSATPGNGSIKVEGAAEKNAPVTVMDLPSAIQGTVPSATSRKFPDDLAIPTSTLPMHEKAAAVSPALQETTAPLADIAAPAAPASSPTPGNVPQPVTTAPVADLSASLGQQVIDMGSGGQWIDGLAHEIATLSKGEGHGTFRLSPENLGPMRVDIRPGEQGANVTLTVETKAAEAMLLQDRNLLKADAQLAAVRIDDVTVQRVAQVNEPSRADTATGQGTGGQGSGGQSQQQTQTSSQGQSGQGSNNAAMAQGQGQSGQNGNNARNHKVSSDAVVSSQAEPRDVAQGQEPDATRCARYA